MCSRGMPVIGEVEWVSSHRSIEVRSNAWPSDVVTGSFITSPVMGHMNADHGDSTVAMVEHYIGLPQVEKAELVQLDRLGFMVQVTRADQTFKLRLPFPRPAADRKDVKTLIVQMTQESMGNPKVAAWAEARKQEADAAFGKAPAKA